MTRKDELKDRASKFMETQDRYPYRTSIDMLTDMLQQIERDVLERVYRRYHHHEYMSDCRTFDEWLTAQQKELG